MNFTDVLKEAVNKLSAEFDVQGDLIDLSDFTLPDGKKKIFDSLKELHKPAFENNQRILIYQPNNDVYSYADNEASDSIIFLQQCLQQIDISNFFVIVLTGNRQVNAELEWTRKNHSSDTVPIGFYLLDTEFNKTVLLGDTFCVNMWNHLYIDTQLNILPCCIADRDRSLGNLATQTVEEIVNGKASNNIRLNMLQGKRCNECSSCYEIEDSGLTSRRQRENKRFESVIDNLKSQTNSDGSLVKFKPTYFDIRLNNICNLKCRTCSGEFSSMLAQEEKKLFNNVVNFQRIPTTESRAKVLNSIIDYFDQAETIYFAGGEPLILNEHYEILDFLIKQNKTDIQIFYNTNFTNLTFKDKNIVDYWKKFSNITLGASLDGHGKIFEYIRHGAKWDKIENNLLAVQTKCPHVNITVSSTVSLLSFESIMELQKLWHTTNKLDINQFRINTIVGSPFLSLQSLPTHHKQYAAEKIKNHCQWLRSVNATKLATDWEDMANSMWAKDLSYVNQQFSHVNQARDINRNENFEMLYPHFSDLFRSYYNQ